MKHLNADLDNTTNIEVPLTPSNRILGLDVNNNIVEIQGSGGMGDGDDDFELGDDMDNTLVGQTYCYTAGDPLSECYVIGASVRISQDNTTSYAEGIVTSLDVTTSTTGGSTNTPDCGGWEEGDAISGTYWEWEVVSQTLGQEPWGPGGVYFDHGIDWDWEFPNGVVQWLLFDVNGGQEGVVDGDSSPVNLFVGQKLYGKFGTYAESYNDGNATPIGGTFTSSRLSSEGTTTLRKVRQITTAPAPQKWISRAYLVGNPLNTSTLTIVEEEAVFPSLRGNTVGNNLGTVRYQGNNYVMQNGFMPAGTGVTNLTPAVTFDQAHTSTTADDGVYETFAFSQNVPTKKVVCESDGSFNPIGDGTTTSSTTVCVEITNVNADASTNFEFDIVSTNTYTATVICPSDGDVGPDGDIDLGDGDLIVDGGEDNGDGTISSKTCSGQVAITNNTASGSIHTLTLLTGIASDFKIGDTVKFFNLSGTEITTVTATLTSKIKKGETTLRVQATTGNLSSITAGTLIEVCPGTGTIVIDGDGDTDGDVEVDGDGNVDMDGDLNIDGDINLDDDNDDTGDGMIGTKGCSGQIDISAIASNGAVITLTTSVDSDYKDHDPIKFYTASGTEITTVTARLSADISKGQAIISIESTGGALSSITTDMRLEICPATGTIIIDGDDTGDGCVEIDGDGNIDMDGDLGFDNDMDDNGNGMIGTKPCSPRIEITQILGKNTVLQETTYTVALENQILDSFKADDVVDVYANFTSLQKRFSGTTPYRIAEESGIIYIRVNATDIIEVGDHIEVCPASGTLTIDGDTTGDGDVEIDGDGNIQTDGDVGIGDGMLGNEDGDISTDPGQTITHTITAAVSEGSSASGQTVRLTFNQAVGLQLGVTDPITIFDDAAGTTVFAESWKGPGGSAATSTSTNAFFTTAQITAAGGVAGLVGKFAIFERLSSFQMQPSSRPGGQTIEFRGGGAIALPSTGEFIVGDSTTRTGDGYLTSTAGLVLEADATQASIPPTSGIQLKGAGLAVAAGQTMNVTINSDGQLGTGTSGGGGGGLNFAGVLTANTQLVSNNIYLVNATSDVTLMLPGGGTGLNPTTIASVVRPTVGDMIEIRKRTSSTPYSVTVNAASYMFSQSGDEHTVYDDIEGQGTAAGDFTFGDPPRANTVNFSAFKDAQQDLIITNNNPNESFKLIYASNELGWIKF